MLSDSEASQITKQFYAIGDSSLPRLGPTPSRGGRPTVAQNDIQMINKNPSKESVIKTYYVYIMTNHSGTLYTGVTNNLERRVYEHKRKLVPGFTSKYNITKLVYYEEGNDVNRAIAREKQIKGWLRIKKNCIDRIRQSRMARFKFGLV